MLTRSSFRGALIVTVVLMACDPVIFAPPTIRSNRMFPPALEGVWAVQNPMPNIVQVRPNRFHVAEPVDETETAVQEHSDWCWAAAISLALRYQHINESQKQIVRFIHPDEDPSKSQAATLGQIIKVLNRYTFDVLGRPTVIVATAFQNDAYYLVQDLSLQWPPLIGLQNESGTDGHVYILKGADYGYSAPNQIFFYSVRLYDPWPKDGGWKTLSGEEFRERIQFAVRLRVAHG